MAGEAGLEPANHQFNRLRPKPPWDFANKYVDPLFNNTSLICL